MSSRLMRHTCHWPLQGLWPYGDQQAQRAYALSTGCQACLLNLPANYLQRPGYGRLIAVLVPLIVDLLVLWPIMAMLDLFAWVRRATRRLMSLFPLDLGWRVRYLIGGWYQAWHIWRISHCGLCGSRTGPFTRIGRRYYCVTCVLV